MNAGQETPLLASFIRHQNDLLSFLSFKLSCAETAGDIVQETYLRIANYPKTEEIKNPRAFLFRIANNLALDHLRKRAFQVKFNNQETDHEPLVREAEEPLTAINTIQQLEILEQLIEGLPFTCRKVFLLSRVEGKTYKAIGKELGISERTVENHVYKALKMLKEQYKSLD